MDSQIVLLIILVVVSITAVLIAKFMPDSAAMLSMPMQHSNVPHSLDIAYSPIANLELNEATAASDPLSLLTSRVTNVETKLAEQLALSSVNKEQLKYLTSNANKTSSS